MFSLKSKNYKAEDYKFLSQLLTCGYATMLKECRGRTCDSCKCRTGCDDVYRLLQHVREKIS